MSREYRKTRSTYHRPRSAAPCRSCRSLGFRRTVRVERGFSTAQDRLVKGLRVAGISCLEKANAYLEQQFLPWWNRMLTVAAKNNSDAHRPLTPDCELASILSHVEERQISNGYTVQYHGHHVPDSAPPGAHGNARFQAARRSTAGRNYCD